MESNVLKALNISILAVESVSLLFSFSGYIFILAVNILDWIKNKRLDISDQIISGLGVFSLLQRTYQVSIRCVALMYGLHDITRFAWLCIHLTYSSIDLCTLLFSSLLGVHFCLKIVNLNQNFYIYIQSMFPKMFPWILLLSVLTSLLISGPAAWDLSQHDFNSTGQIKTSHSPLNRFLSLKFFYAFFSFCFLIFLMSLLVTIVSLHKHVRRMQNNATKLRAESAEAHVNAVRTLLSLLCLNLLYFILPIIIIYKKNEPQWMNGFLLIYAMCHIFDIPILIRGSTKLQKRLKKMWFHFATVSFTII
ncbi:hypothetical protein GDO81_021874 [Engystomops pustulosus]|uniref:Taste receptor type 2 n=1 Tax=Engystomops pustulosus TaxID=76066 RepID=A0AAV6YN42_ENGPU|nr:hypothetical protein GDO81_021874 [Engystomops pustulosus]